MRRDSLVRPAASLPLRMLDSATLFRGEHEIGIEHHGALYRLKITRQGKLILNK
ncbi:MAG: hemin uptake protein HemP [Pseudomonadota bacterium]|nr:hemin uptake protein HemP [Mesorhizobium sp.]